MKPPGMLLFAISSRLITYFYPLLQDDVRVGVFSVDYERILINKQSCFLQSL
jgi:hypothetical protein